MKLLSLLKKTTLVISIMYITLGVMIILKKEESNLVVMEILSIGLIFSGLLSIIKYFTTDVKERYKGDDFIIGSLLIAIAASVYLTRDNFSNIGGELLAIAIIVSGLHKFQDLFDLRAVNIKQAPIYLFGFVVCTGIGVLLLSDIIETSSIRVVILGLGLLLSGISDVVSNFYVSTSIYKYINEKERSDEAS